MIISNQDDCDRILMNIMKERNHPMPIAGRLIVEENEVLLSVETAPQNYEFIKLFPDNEIEIYIYGRFIKEPSDRWYLYDRFEAKVIR